MQSGITFPQFLLKPATRNPHLWPIFQAHITNATPAVDPGAVSTQWKARHAHTNPWCSWVKDPPPIGSNTGNPLAFLNTLPIWPHWQCTLSCHSLLICYSLASGPMLTPEITLGSCNGHLYASPTSSPNISSCMLDQHSYTCLGIHSMEGMQIPHSSSWQKGISSTSLT